MSLVTKPLALKELLNHYKEEEIITDTKLILTFKYTKISKTTKNTTCG